MRLAHLSDLHLRDESDAVEFERQLGRIAARGADHLAITGDLLDRWSVPLLRRTLDALQAHGFLSRERLTILHGNHDLASSGGHPRNQRDLWRLVLRFWDPPPLLRGRAARFYGEITSRAPGVAQPPPWSKSIEGGLTLAVLNSVPHPWMPFRLRRREVVLRHTLGTLSAADATWLASQRGASALVVLLHHYPGDVPPFSWHASGAAASGSGRFGAWKVTVPMHIPAPQRAPFWDAARQARVTAVLCGHVHRARLERHDGIAVGLNGQSGAAWAGRTIAYYTLRGGQIEVEYDSDGPAAVTRVRAAAQNK